VFKDESTYEKAYEARRQFAYLEQHYPEV